MMLVCSVQREPKVDAVLESCRLHFILMQKVDDQFV